MMSSLAGNALKKVMNKLYERNSEDAILDVFIRAGASIEEAEYMRSIVETTHLSTEDVLRCCMISNAGYTRDEIKAALEVMCKQ